MIARGSTVTLTYPIPTFTSTIVALYVTYTQHGYTVLEKALTDVTVETVEEETSVKVNLTQLDTLKFKETKVTSKDSVQVQIRLRTQNGEAYSSEIMNDTVQDCLKDGVI